MDVNHPKSGLPHLPHRMKGVEMSKQYGKQRYTAVIATITCHTPRSSVGLAVSNESLSACSNPRATRRDFGATVPSSSLPFALQIYGSKKEEVTRQGICCPCSGTRFGRGKETGAYQLVTICVYEWVPNRWQAVSTTCSVNIEKVLDQLILRVSTEGIHNLTNIRSLLLQQP